MSWQQSLKPQNTGTSNVLQGIREVPNLLWKFRELPNQNENKIKYNSLENIYEISEVPNLPWKFREVPN